MTAAEITVEGRVQGVGFRAHVELQASLLGVAGYVMNLADGRVQVHAEGVRSAVEALVAEVRRGPRAARVTRAAVRWLEPSHRFRSFEIRYGVGDDAV